MSDEAYESYVTKCAAFGMIPTPKEQLEKDSCIKPNFIDMAEKVAS